jgi:2,5-dihydroxypyridine 5,6-dioxygenase
MSGVIGGYPGHHVSNPYLLPLLLQATKNCVENFCKVKQGEKVLIVSEFDTDPLVASAFAASATEAGGDSAIITIPPLSVGGWVRNSPGDMLVGAFEKADVVIACTYFEFAHNERTFFSKIFGGKSRVCSVLMGATPGALISAGRFPIPLYCEIGERAMKLVKPAKKIRYTTTSGTDITFEGPQGVSYGEPLVPGTWAIFPPMGINFYPLNSNGVLTPDETSLTGKLSSPIRFTIENNFVVKVEGASGAERNAIDSFRNGKFYLRHSVIGLNPKVRMGNAPEFERERAAGTTYLGIDGTGPSGEIDRTKPGFSHLDMIFDTPTVYVDDFVIVRDRRLLLLEDPELLEAAKKFGEPSKVLAQNPLLW